jgi:predicted transcriptional regulator
VTSSWTFLSHHAQVLLAIAADPDIRLRDVARDVGLTERAVQTLVNDLVDEGYISRSRVGRRNHYSIHPEVPLRHPMQRDRGVGSLLALLGPERAATR